MATNSVNNDTAKEISKEIDRFTHNSKRNILLVLQETLFHRRPIQGAKGTQRGNGEGPLGDKFEGEDEIQKG